MATSLEDLQQKVAAAAAVPGPIVDTYLISAGKLQLIESHLSQGMADDVKLLLQTEQSAAPSEHLGLSIEAHGSGLEMGMLSDRSRASTKDLHDAIQVGLGNGKKLDILDLDACLMASTNTPAA